jgi:hypothetical protein
MAHRSSPNEPDYKEFLKELLDRYQRAETHDDMTLERFAQAGAEALSALLSGKNGYTLEEAAESLGITLEQARGLIETQRSAGGQVQGARLHPLDVSLYRSKGSSRVGAKEDQVTPLPTPPEDPSQSWDPRRDLTPG